MSSQDKVSTEKPKKDGSKANNQLKSQIKVHCIKQPSSLYQEGEGRGWESCEQEPRGLYLTKDIYEHSFVFRLPSQIVVNAP